jgi:succinyl-CoA synthetase, alpha subunit
LSILVNNKTRLLVQGITGREGAFHTKQMLAYGTQVVAGVTPGKAGESVEGVPVYNTVREAVDKHGVNTSIIFVPPRFAADAALEAIDAGIELVVCITEWIPVHEMMEVTAYARAKGTRLVGPNCPGVISPGEALVGILPGGIFKPGPVGLVSRSGTLTYEVVNELTTRGIGQSTCVGIGGDPIIGTRFIDVLRLFEEDPQTEVIVMIGEIGGSDEEEAAEYIKTMKKPVVGFISGRTAPPGKRMGHAGAIISGNTGTAESKIRALTAANVPVADTINEIVDLVEQRLK